MTLKNVANEDLTIEPKESGITGAAFAVTSDPSDNVRAAGKRVYRGGIGFTVTGATKSGCVQGAPVSGTIDPTATQTNADGDPVNRKGDESAELTINGTDGGGNPCSFKLTAKITGAGQNKVKAQ